MSSDQQIIKNIKADKIFFDFIDDEVCDGLDITAIDFFESLSKILSELQDSNHSLLNKRDKLQSQIDDWHIQNKAY
jgi:Malate synthase